MCMCVLVHMRACVFMVAVNIILATYLLTEVELMGVF
jgi:hypothetical protein